MGLRGAAGYGAVAVFWASFFALYTLSVQSLGIPLAAALFGLCGGLFLLGFAKAVGRKVSQPPSWNAVVYWALFGWTILISISLAMRMTGAAVTAILISSLPLFATVFAQMRGQARVTGVGAISLFFGISGLVLVGGFPAGDASLPWFTGVVAALIAAVSAGWCGRPLVNRLHKEQSVQTAGLASILGGVAVLGAVPLVDPPTAAAQFMPVVVVLALCFAFLALFSLSSASNGVSARIAGTLPGVGTVLTVVAGIVFLQERVSVAQIIGMVLILASTAMLRGLVPRWFPTSWRA